MREWIDTALASPDVVPDAQPSARPNNMQNKLNVVKKIIVFAITHCHSGQPVRSYKNMAIFIMEKCHVKTQKAEA
jgi:hypothetical protein